jgi:hypothetical protein
MAHTLIPTNALFVFLAKSMANDTPGTYAEYMALGTGTGQAADDTTLATETVISGLARAKGTLSTVKTTIDNDTSQITLAFTSAGADATITEVGQFVSAVKDEGNMHLYGTFGTGMPISSGDKITPTLQCQMKLGS